MPDRTEACAARPWMRLLDRALGPSRDVPTMLSVEEQKLYYWLAAFWAEGAGAIVDLGCFAGGSTARLAEGRRAAGHGGAVHAFDRFTADETAKRGILYPQGVPAFEGPDILPLARRLLAPWEGLVSLHRGEIDAADWAEGPIEVLVMDASKTAATGDAMAGIFFPHLIAGRSLIVQQDYLHWSQPWVPAQMEALAKCVRPVAHAPRDTVVFLVEQVPDDGALSAARIAGLEDTALDAHLAAAEARLGRFGLAPRLAETRAALAANPGERRAFAFRRP